MKYLITTIAALVLVGCGESQQSDPSEETKHWRLATEVKVGIESEKFQIPNPNEYKLFFFKPSTKGIHNITTTSIPERVDQAWFILDENGNEIQRCDFDIPLRGTESADTKFPLKKGEPVYLGVFNFTGDELNEPAEVVEFTITIVPAKTVIKRSLEAKADRPAWMRNSIQNSAMIGDIEAVKWHLANGPDINARDNDGVTPLIWAAVRNKMQTVELLIAEGADVNAKDRFNKTPLYRAAFAGRSEIVRVLIANGAGVNVKDAKGETPLDAAERIIEDTTAPHSLEYKAAKKRTAALLRKHGGKTAEELKAEGE